MNNAFYKPIGNGKVRNGSRIIDIPKLADGTPMELFKSYPATSKIKYGKGEHKIKIGESIWVRTMPSGEIYIFKSENSILAIKMDAVHSVDFEWRTS